ncbi:hypothetical protein FB459_1310 [Yimella lutea]|uniref:Uncharacterized protein n=1 Tax=Yimella lutea TaxID=587872 RepID=A0A542EEX5_9MICO|nr:hypothetical protein [Yimella lutea]TQJ13874.1 hypothetical protein FB459_1310 [Yimella lutea]
MFRIGSDQDDPRVQAYDPDPFEDHTHDEVGSSGKHAPRTT